MYSIIMLLLALMPWIAASIALIAAAQVKIGFTFGLLVFVAWVLTQKTKAEPLTFCTKDIERSSLLMAVKSTKTKSDFKDILKVHVSSTPDGFSFWRNLIEFLPKLVVSSSVVVGTDLIVFMVNGRHDSDLISGGKKFGLPRGFPVVYNTATRELYAGGFFPKFQNDSKDTNLTFTADASDSINITRKISGFLSNVVLVEVDGAIRYIVTSKKYSGEDSKYVTAAQRILKPILTPEILQLLWNKGIRTLSSEVLSEIDQVHGSMVKKESIFIHAAAFNITAETIRPNVIGGTQLFQLLEEVGLGDHGNQSIDIPSHLAEGFFTKLNERRDTMTESGLCALLDEIGLEYGDRHSKISRHSEILGDTLEGLVIRVTKSDGSVVTTKYKFANYTVRTMILRNFSSGGRSGDGALYKPVGIIKDGIWSPSEQFLECIPKFVDRWVFTEYGEAFYPIYLNLYGELYDDALSKWVRENETSVAPWITAADLLNEQLADGRALIASAKEADPSPAKEADPSPAKEADPSPSETPLRAYLFVGPVAIGKSVCAAALAHLLQVPHIDGDKFWGLTEEEVRSLGEERTPLTVCCITEALREHGSVVVSLGGGAICVGAETKWLTNKIEKSLDQKVEFVVLFPGDCWSDKLPDIDSIKKLYEDEVRLSASMQGRLERGAIHHTKIPQVKTASKRNVDYVDPLYEYCAGTFPIILDGVEIPIPVADNLSFLSSFSRLGTSKHVPKENIKRHQERTLYLYTKNHNKPKSQQSLAAGHTTDLFSSKPLTSDAHEVIQPVDKTPIDARLVVLKGLVSLILLDSTSDQHITVNPGPHEASSMRIIARAVNGGQCEVSLSLKRKNLKAVPQEVPETITYNLSDCMEVFPIVVTPMLKFYIC